VQVCQGRAPDDRPPYFKFMTILAFNIFWREGVDVAIVEVGIGGQYDCTNILRNPRVTGQHQSASVQAVKNMQIFFCA
jgi:folylpolyglutamate synthase